MSNMKAIFQAYEDLLISVRVIGEQLGIKDGEDDEYNAEQEAEEGMNRENPS